ncbi:unnamed protein product, partial [Allacma fusca]
FHSLISFKRLHLSVHQDRVSLWDGFVTAMLNAVPTIATGHFLRRGCVHLDSGAT